MVENFADSHAEEVFHFAIRALASPEPSQRERLRHAVEYHLATLQSRELPAAIENKFVEFLSYTRAANIVSMTDDEVSKRVRHLIDLYLECVQLDRY